MVHRRRQTLQWPQVAKPETFLQIILSLVCKSDMKESHCVLSNPFVVDRLTTTRALCCFLYCGFPYARQQDMTTLQWKTNKQNVKQKQNKARKKQKRISSDLNKLLENHLYFISVYNTRIFPRNIVVINLCARAHGHITRYISVQIMQYMTSHVVPFYLWMGSQWPHHVKCQHLVCHMWRHTP